MGKVFKGSWIRNMTYSYLGQRRGDKTGMRNKWHRQKYRQVDIFWMNTPFWCITEGYCLFLRLTRANWYEQNDITFRDYTFAIDNAFRLSTKRQRRLRTARRLFSKQKICGWLLQIAAFEQYWFDIGAYQGGSAAALVRGGVGRGVF